MMTMIMLARLSRPALLVIVFVFALGCGLHQTERGQILFATGEENLLGLKDKWPDGSSTGVTLQTDPAGRLVIAAATRSQSYASAYTDLEIDLDRYGVLEIDVAEVTKSGYVLLNGPNMENGYVSLSPNFSRPGVYRYDLRQQTGHYAGRISVRLQLGISTGSTTPLGQEKLVIQSLRLLPLEKPAFAANEIPVFKAGDGKAAEFRFTGCWPDGVSANASARVWRERLVIEGTSDTESFGHVAFYSSGYSTGMDEQYSDTESFGHVAFYATVDLDRFGGLEIDVDSVSRAGFVVINHPSLPQEYVRAIPEIRAPGRYSCDLRRLLGRGGLAFLRVQLGVTTLRGDQVVKNHFLMLRRIAFTASPIRQIDGIEQVGGPVAIPAFAPAVGSVWPDLAPLMPERFTGAEALEQAAPGAVTVQGNRIVVRGGFTEATFSARDGAILGIRDLRGNREVATGGTLFTVETAESGVIESTRAVAEGLATCRLTTDENGATWTYSFAGGEIAVLAAPQPSGVALSAELASTGARWQSLSLPGRLGLPLAGLEEMVIPNWIGIGLKPGFFREQHYHTFNYPSAFADFAHVRYGDAALMLLGGGLPGRTDLYGNLIRYRGEGIRDGEWIGMRPLTVTVGGENGEGMIVRTLPIRLVKGRSLSSGEVLLAAGLPLSGAVELYRTRVYPPDVKNLESRLGSERFAKFSRGSLIKFDCGSYTNLDDILTDIGRLPAGIILHPVIYWPGGFDANYPDFFTPPDKQVGGVAGLKRLVAAAHERGMLVIPYVNPTWWNPCPTSERIGIENVSIRKEDGSIPEDVYNNRSGWIVSPWAGPVRKTRIGLHEAALKTYGMDGLFEDQIGARDWQPDFSKSAPAPFAYAAGMVDFARDNPLQTILMTERGFDMLAPYEHSFCGVSDIWTYPNLPRTEEQDRKFGRGNWRTVPLATMISRDLTDFMQHNLAVEVKTDNGLKLAWNLVYGYRLFQIMWRGVTQEDQAWINLVQLFQREVYSRITGKRLVWWDETADGTVRTAYENGMYIAANLGTAGPLAFGGVTVPPNGVIATDHGLAAGVFSRVGDFDFPQPIALILRRQAGEADTFVELFTAAPTRSLVAVPRDPSWKRNAGVTVRDQDGVELPAATSDHAIIFVNRPRPNGEARYMVSYRELDWDARLVAPAAVVGGDTVRVQLQFAAGEKPIEVQAASVTAWLVSGGQAVPGPDSFPAAATRPVSCRVAARGGTQFEYELTVPPDLRAGERVWIAALIRTPQGRVMVSKVIHAVPGLTLEAVIPETMRTWWSNLVDARIENRTSRTVEGALQILVDGRPVADKALAVKLEPRRGWTMPLTLPPVGVGRHQVALLFEPGAGFETLRLSRWVEGVAALDLSDFAGRNLIPQSGMRTYLRLRTPLGQRFDGTALLSADGGWKLEPSRIALKIGEGQEVRIPVRIVPGNLDRSRVFARFLVGDTTLTASFTEPFARVQEAVSVLRADLDGDGQEEIAIGHRGLEAQVAPHLGGRIMLLAGADGENQVFAAYPAVKPHVNPRVWVEYGGINDWWPRGWPGDVWNNTWSVEKAEIQSGGKAALVMKSRSEDGALELKRALTIAEASPVLAVEYEITNNSKEPVEQVWAAHPDLAPGRNGAGQSDVVLVPGEGEVQVHAYRRRNTKFSFKPTAGWAAAADRTSNHFFATLFAPGSLAEIGVWEGLDFFSLELIHPAVKLGPGERQVFTVGYAVGVGDPAKVAPRWSEELAAGQTVR